MDKFKKEWLLDADKKLKVLPLKKQNKKIAEIILKSNVSQVNFKTVFSRFFLKTGKFGNSVFLRILPQNTEEFLKLK